MPNITYSSSSYILTKDVEIDTIDVINTGSSAVYSISTQLPNGLLFDTSTGQISGIATELLTNATTFTITATNDVGSDTFDLSIQVLEGMTIIVTIMFILSQ